MRLYHFTAKEHIESIEEHGLIPKIADGAAAVMTRGIPVVWLTSKPIPAWMISAPKEGELVMLTINAKRGRHLIRWAPWLRQTDINIVDEETGEVIHHHSGAEIMAALGASAEPFSGPFIKDAKAGVAALETYYISTAVIKPRRIIGCAAVKYDIVETDKVA